MVRPPGRQCDEGSNQEVPVLLSGTTTCVSAFYLAACDTFGQYNQPQFSTGILSSLLSRLSAYRTYMNLFNDRLFVMALRNTAIFAFSTVVIGMALSLALAVALNRPSRLTGLYQTLYFLPVITPMVPVSVIWKWIYDPGYGLLTIYYRCLA